MARTKAELLAEASELGVEVPENATNPEIEALIAAKSEEAASEGDAPTTDDEGGPASEQAATSDDNAGDPGADDDDEDEDDEALDPDEIDAVLEDPVGLAKKVVEAFKADPNALRALKAEIAAIKPEPPAPQALTAVQIASGLEYNEEAAKALDHAQVAKITGVAEEEIAGWAVKQNSVQGRPSGDAYLVAVGQDGSKTAVLLP